MRLHFVLLVKENSRFVFKILVNMGRIFFSEENIWKLCETWRDNDLSHVKFLYAVFISNTERQIPIWKQKSSSRPDELVIWV